MFLSKSTQASLIKTLFVGVFLSIFPSLVSAKTIRLLISDDADKLIANSKSLLEIIDKKKSVNSAEFLLNTETNNTDLPIKIRTKAKDQIIKLEYWQNGEKHRISLREELLLIPQNSKFTIINKLDLEEYLRTVLPSEMPASWPIEALKAQSIAARTYTLKNLEYVNEDSLFDIKATVEDQAFKGVSQQNNKTNQAINETSQKVLVDKYGNLIDAYYSSSSGPITAAPEDTWGIAARGYLRNLPNIKEGSNLDNWELKFPISKLNKVFSNLTAKGEITSLLFQNSNNDGRLKSVLIMYYDETGKLSSNILIGEEFRHKLSLPSANFNFKRNSKEWVFYGHGFGHGIGLSQYGARKLALAGKSDRFILEKYYPAARIVKLD